MTSPPNFDRVARLYRWAEYLSLGPLLQRTRTHFLPQLSRCRRALILGDGDGRFTAAFAARYPETRILAVDISATMLHLLRQRWQHIPPRHADSLQTLQASALDVTPTPDTDLVVTHFFLDCLTQPEVDRLIHTYAANLAPRALWLLSDFRIPAAGPLRPLARIYIRLLYLAFRLLTGLRVTQLSDPAPALRNAGFHLQSRHTLLGGVLYTELWSTQPSGPTPTPQQD